MAISAAKKALVQFAYRGGMALVPAAEAAGVTVSSARRWVKDVPAGTPPAPADDRVEVLAALQRIERELAFDPTEDAVILPQIAVATTGDLRRLQRAVWRAGGAIALATLALAIAVVAF